MKKNKGLFVLIASVLVLTLFSCTNSNSSQNSSNVAGNSAMKVGLITDLGGINDHSMNQLSYEGLKSLHEKHPEIEISYLESKLFSDYALNVETYVNEGYDLIITVGATFIETIMDVANEYPDNKFAIVGVPIPKEFPNVSSIIFANEESGYIAGAAAALTTKTNTIGYVQGMVNDTLNLFGIGYVRGAKSINDDINILMYNANNFADIAGGNVAATNMIKNGADVIYQMAGATGIGVINACADNDIYAIGSDTDQSPIAENNVLLSALQLGDKAVENYVLDFKNNGFKSGTIIQNIANGNIAFAYNDKAIDATVKSKLQKIEKDILNKKITINTNTKDCPEFTLDK